LLSRVEHTRAHTRVEHANTIHSSVLQLALILAVADTIVQGKLQNTEQTNCWAIQPCISRELLVLCVLTGIDETMASCVTIMDVIVENCCRICRLCISDTDPN
jgi:hypothetical protein